jgi:predicted anti-sigma-YlaC factor YlaD
MQCREFREIADSYLSNELMVETNHGVIAHLEQCAECRQELKARRELRGQASRGVHKIAREPIATRIRCPSQYTVA